MKYNANTVQQSIHYKYNIAAKLTSNKLFKESIVNLGLGTLVTLLDAYFYEGLMN